MRTQYVDTKSEIIELVGTSHTDVSGLATAISETEPRYTLYRYSHTFGGAEESPLLFIYTCPSGLKVRERMLYASSKAGFLAALSKDMGLEVMKKVSSLTPSPLVSLNLSSSRSQVPLRSLYRLWKRNSDPSRSKSKGFRDRRDPVSVETHMFVESPSGFDSLPRIGRALCPALPLPALKAIKAYVLRMSSYCRTKGQ